MDLNEAKQILTNNGFICEAKTITNLKQMVKNFCDNPDAYKVAKLKKQFNFEDAIWGKQMFDDGVPCMKYWFRNYKVKNMDVTIKEGTNCIVSLDYNGEPEEVWIPYRGGWLLINKTYYFNEDNIELV